MKQASCSIIAGGFDMDINEYESFCAASEYATFTQSARWARVKNNWIAEYVAVRDKAGRIEGTCLVLVRKIPIFNTAMLYAPRGFICDMNNRVVVGRIFEKIKKIAEKYHAYTLKLDPMIDEENIEAVEILKNLGFRHHGEKVGYQNIQCRENYVLDLDGRNIDAIFESFKPKWRYNIRLAVRRGVECGFFGKEKLDDFCTLMELTGQRDGFGTRGREYFARVLDAFDGRARLCMCYLGDIPLSGALVIFYGGTASYVYGCSSNEHRECMPNYLMQWTMIKCAKEIGCTKYDFCGIPYWYDKTHRNYGVYRFKQGFNGRVVTYAGEFDFTFRSVIKKLADIAVRVRESV